MALYVIGADVDLVESREASKNLADRTRDIIKAMSTTPLTADDAYKVLIARAEAGGMDHFVFDPEALEVKGQIHDGK